jgi:septal ring factor EnvC (AmiA/AmiB activator)
MPVSQNEKWRLFDDQVRIEQHLRALSGPGKTAADTFDFLHMLSEGAEAGEGLGNSVAIELANEHMAEELKAKLREINRKTGKLNDAIAAAEKRRADLQRQITLFDNELYRVRAEVRSTCPEHPV